VAEYGVLEAITQQRNHHDPAWWEDLSLITARTLVIAGGTNSHLPQDQIASLAGRIPDAMLVTINAGHNVHTSRPNAFLAELLPFLAWYALDFRAGKYGISGMRRGSANPEKEAVFYALRSAWRFRFASDPVPMIST
jgi:hypothetical protein